MSIYLKETAINETGLKEPSFNETRLGHSTLMLFNIESHDPILTNCQTLIFINPLIWADLNSMGCDRPSRFPDGGSVQIPLSSFNHGVSHIAHILEQCPQVRSLHIYTTGRPGRLELGRDVLTNKTIERYAWQLQSWFSGLPSYVTPTLTLGHCNVGDGLQGIRLIDQLHHLTGCHIHCLSSANGRHLQAV
ncbi:MAG: DUF4347 domain-containing protein [Leptolyngbyaceae bacterium]|nr:DUF4347 domain-containing protein [Leptolyngbyaceae bacterium]